MSDTRIKSCIRFELPDLKGASYATALKFFEPILGPPSGVSKDEEGHTTWFRYDPPKAAPPPEYFMRPCRSLEGDSWGAELVLLDATADGERYDVGKDCCVSGIDLEAPMMHCNDLEKKGLVPDADFPPKFYFYLWYTGCDEPITFD